MGVFTQLLHVPVGSLYQVYCLNKRISFHIPPYYNDARFRAKSRTCRVSDVRLEKKKNLHFGHECRTNIDLFRLPIAFYFQSYPSYIRVIKTKFEKEIKKIRRRRSCSPDGTIWSFLFVVFQRPQGP